MGGLFEDTASAECVGCFGGRLRRGSAATNRVAVGRAIGHPAESLAGYRANHRNILIVIIGARGAIGAPLFRRSYVVGHGPESPYGTQLHGQ